MIICVTGMPGSGKTTVASILGMKGFRRIEMSNYIRALMKRRHVPINQKSIDIFSPNLKRRFGKDIIAKLIVKDIRNWKGSIVISGFRNLNELEYIKHRLKGQVIVIGVISPAKTRYKRLFKRKNSMRSENYGQFLLRDKKNRELGTMQVIKKADYLIMNTGTTQELRRNVNKLIKLAKMKGLNT